MPRYVALLRGINVGGNTMIKMEELRAMFEALHFDNVVSYINSGNIAFDLPQGPGRSKVSRQTELALISEVESAIQSQFGRPVQVVVRQQAEIDRIIADNPFAGEFESHKEMHVLFMKDHLPDEKRDQLLASALDGERYAVTNREIYCHLRQGFADSLLTKGFLDKKLKVIYTARNWRTVQKLSEL
jgi:uncharacterized protein (DUF1697 family)